jgi:hypothetical protein
MDTHHLREGDLESAFWASFVHDIQRQDDNLTAQTFVPDTLGAQVSAPECESTVDDDIRR